jgi:peptide/nickel transport system substrate-binding protein
MEMKRSLRGFAAAGSLFLAMFVAEAAFAQKQGGILKMYSPDSPASMSIHEEATVFAEGPMMGVFNNLVMFDHHVPQNEGFLLRRLPGTTTTANGSGEAISL